MTPERPRHVAFLSRPQRLAHLMTSLLLTVALLLGGPLQVQAANLPTGGSVAAGSATVGTATGNALTVTQTSSSAVINWQSFSVGQGYSVNFVQPSSSSTILNRVTGSATSTIAGAITANGHVYLINPNGIVITATGTVNTAGFVASTLGISDADFMAGKRTFTGNGASAAVSNSGVITIGRGGYAALLGGAVDNAGAIVVPLGKVGLGSGEQATLDLSGDGFLQVAIPTSATGTGALVANSGRILADGGLVLLSAAAAKDMARQAINMSGTIEAKSASGVSGDIVLAGSDGAVDVSGKLDASSDDGNGGAITVTGRAISLTGASLDASGLAGGGSIKIGGDRQGTGTLQHADTVSVDAASTITADATSTGNGGDVVLWSDELTTFAGTISAKGGALSGNGGQAEVSGKKLLAYTGFTNLSAAHGSFGTLLLDPYNVTISSGADSNADTTSNAGTTTFTATGDNSVINAATLISALGSANVTVSTGSGGSQTGDITVASALSWSSGSTLTLSAAGSIAVNADINIAGSGGLALVYASNLTFGSGGSVSYTGSGGTLAINSVHYTLLYSMDDFSAINATATSLAGYYALATSLTAPSTTYTDALVGTGSSSAFTGTFEGLGNTITGLTIAKSGDYAGLFGYVGSVGVVRDIGLVGGSVSGKGSVGGLVGYNEGTISNAYTTGAVSGNNYVGGLVGYNHLGAISNAHATGAVSGGIDGGSSDLFGGLVGYSEGGTLSNVYATGTVTAIAYFVGGLAGAAGGTITNAYATGAVRASYNYVGGFAGSAGGTFSNVFATGTVRGASCVGGLIGIGAGTITNAYATGAVTGDSSVGGLVGYNYGGTVTNAYWDTGTSGQSTSAGGVGRTTAQLQTLATTNLGSAFGSGRDLYPYLISFFPNGVQAISGTAYKDSGTTELASSGWHGALVSVRLGNGTTFTTTTGANGYYYIAVANGSIDATNGTGVLAYTVTDSSTGATNAATYTTKATGTLSGFNVYGGVLTQIASGVTTLSALDTAYASAILDNTTVAGFSLANRTITALADFTINAPLTTTGTVTVSTKGNLTIGTNGTVSGASPTLSATEAFINQGGANAVTATSGRWLIYSANSDGDTFGGLDSGNTAVWNTAAGATVNAIGNRYVFAYQPTLKVTPDNSNKTYGEDGATSLTVTYTVTGLSPGVANAYKADTATDILSGVLSSDGLVTTANVGTYGYKVGTLAAANGYAISLQGTGSLTVAARPITVTANAASSIYGDTPSLTYGITSGNLVNGNTLSGSLASGTSSSNVGSYSITQGTLAASANYVVTYVGATLTITARPITVTAAAKSSVYGDATPSLTYGVTSGTLVNGDSLTGSLATTASSTSNVGGYGITQGTLAASANYTVTYAGATLTITARPITVTADAKSSVYGDATPSLTYGVTSGNLVNGDALSGGLATAATSTSNVGTYAITKDTLANSNYAITYVGANLSITARPITVTADAKSSVYGNATPSLTYGVTSGNLVNGDSLTGSLATAASSTSNVGGYGITQGTLAASANYTVTYAGATLTITARPITVTADAKSSVYGDATPSLTYGVTSGNLVNGDALSGSLATAATSTSNVGGYGITQGTLAASANYTVTYAGATLTITARPITVTADAKSSVYGDATPSLTYGITSGSLVNGNTLSGSLATTAASTSNVGTYAITQGNLTNANNGNYNITYVGNTLSITARPITVTADARSSVYGDTPNLTYSVTSGTLVNGNTLSGSLATTATTTSVAGSTYAITQGNVTNANNGNYAITYVGNTLSITARPITVTANSLSSYHGFAIPALTYTVGGSGLANGDTLSGSLATTATSSSSTGTYAITQGSVQASANYIMTFVQGLLTVKTVTIADTSILPSAVERSWRLNTAGAGPAAPTEPLTVTFGGSGGGSERGDEVIFSSPRFDGLAICPGGDCAARPLAQRL